MPVFCTFIAVRIWTVIFGALFVVKVKVYPRAGHGGPEGE